MNIPKTPNTFFNRAIELLLKHHMVIDAGGVPMLDLGKRPMGIKSNRQWQQYLNALLAVHIIGKRNSWVHLHVNRRGLTVYLTVDLRKSE